MPVTAKLSRKFYEKLGDDVATELVEWFNMVDATYRSDLRELNELNFARFDAKLEQRLSELGARFEARLEQRVAELRVEMREGFARVDRRFAELETRLTKRLFGCWIAQAAATAGLVFGVMRMVGR